MEFMWDQRNVTNWKTDGNEDHLVVPLWPSRGMKKEVFVQLLDTNARRGLELDPSADDVVAGDDVISLHWEHPRISQDTALVVRPKKEGTTVIRAIQGGEKVHLNVHVFDTPQIFVTFFFVTDVNGTTHLSPASAATFIKGLNDIYVPQTSVSFLLYRTANINLRGVMDFNKPLPDGDADDDFWEGLRQKVPQFDKGQFHWNVFLVRKWGGHDTINFNAVGTNRIGETFAVIEDAARTFHVMGHEAGHMLGLSHAGRIDQLMKQHSQGELLFWDEVEQVRKNF